MGCHKTDTFQSLNLLHLLQQLGKSHRLVQILSVGIDILSQEHDFYHAVCDQFFNLTDNIDRLTTALPAPDIRYNTITAKIIATEHDIDTGFETVFSLNRQVFYDLVGIFPDVYDHRLG